jgi:hypothetical protein
MSFLIIPYEGESAELTNALKKINIKKKEECKNGSCPLPKPLRFLTCSEVINTIKNTLKNNKVKQITIFCLNESDRSSLIKMSTFDEWEEIKKSGVNINMICN